jgi:hypothetical protein
MPDPNDLFTLTLPRRELGALRKALLVATRIASNTPDGVEFHNALTLLLTATPAPGLGYPEAMAFDDPDDWTGPPDVSDMLPPEDLFLGRGEYP